MPSPHLTRRTMLSTAAAAAAAGTTTTALSPPAGANETAPSALPLGTVRLRPGRFHDNQARTLAYLRDIDVDRLLYSFRANHGLPTEGAEPCGGWEAPDFEFRSHSQGHFLTAWSHAWAVLGDTACRDKAERMVAGLAACQAADADFNDGYLSGFPESDFDTVETGRRQGVPYYCVHKTLQGLLDVWRLIGSAQARDVLFALAGWVDWRTGRLSREQMQTALGIEFGGMNDVLTELHFRTGDDRWLTTARRFDHDAVFEPLREGRDELAGLHANTQIPKIVGAAKEHRATGDASYRDIAENFWRLTTGAHTYVIGGNSRGEFFQTQHMIAGNLADDSCEACNTYNMLKLAREMWSQNPDRAELFDYCEGALYNHLLGQQHPGSEHGHVCYFTSLRAGGRRGERGPAVGGGSYSTDYGTFWCCQATALETNTGLADAVYAADGTVLTVNLYIPSEIDWAEQGVRVVQETAFPVSDTTVLTVEGSGRWTMRLRVPGWCDDAAIAVNGQPQNVGGAPGSYASLTREWSPGDTVEVRLPMRLSMRAANDDANTSAVLYGPVVLCGDYGDTEISEAPTLDPATIARVDDRSLAFTAEASGATVRLIPFYDAHDLNYVVYWDASGRDGGSEPRYRLRNEASGLVLGVQDMSTADGAPVLQWDDSHTPDHWWHAEPSEDALKLRNFHSRKVLGIQDASSADGARALQWSDTGTPDHLWSIVDDGAGSHRIVNGNSDKPLGLLDGSTARGAVAVQDADDGSPDNSWRLVPDGTLLLRNVHSGLFLSVDGASLGNGALAVQAENDGAQAHLWTAVPDGDDLKIRNVHSGKVLGVENESTEAGAAVLQWEDNGTDDHLWSLLHSGDGTYRLRCRNGGKVLSVDDSSTDAGTPLVTWNDDGNESTLWRLA
ncbi:beta-L-arabinofuranosidase domain-containing protein [Salininema proteolyticum]|uniref:Beta-L-arabinofuranosidase domain-containing protein n=1 Tax=Salininema proteolyticum TaxID=1607685 RepID=A0ABV8U381_9ACTN